MLSVFLPGTPIPAPRPRVTKNGTYTPKRYREWRDAATQQIAAVWGQRPPMDGPLTAVVTCLFPRPERLGEGPRVPRPSRPDAENLAKGPMDAANKRAYHDDGQVVELIVRKFYAASSEAPSVAFTVFESPPFEPRTALGQKLWALRKKAVEDGLRLMTADEIEEELKERRGHRSE